MYANANAKYLPKDPTDMGFMLRPGYMGGFAAVETLRRELSRPLGAIKAKRKYGANPRRSTYGVNPHRNTYGLMQTSPHNCLYGFGDDDPSVKFRKYVGFGDDSTDTAGQYSSDDTSDLAAQAIVGETPSYVQPDQTVTPTPASTPAPSTASSLLSNLTQDIIQLAAPVATAVKSATTTVAKPTVVTTTSSTDWLLYGGLAAALGLGYYFFIYKKA
jgi:hypothetical protein